MITKKSLNILKQIQIIPDKKKKLNIIIIKIVTKNQSLKSKIVKNQKIFNPLKKKLFYINA